MTRLVVTQRAQADMERLADFLQETQPEEAARTAALLAESLAILVTHPEVGRRVGTDARELVISRGRSGYLALYEYDDELDTVTVFAFRHQREAGYH